ncbi:MAG: hypothetical protein LPK46_10570 [Bacteroidota bacterium]|nr:hypothetical protein [Bacteroidota bacterium]MDX5506565.1 hypothetical protein [Bacteroidota bacterium]
MKINYQSQRDALLQKGYSLPIGDTISEAWGLFKKDPGNLIIYSIIVMVVNVVISFIPIVGSLASLVLSPLFTAGFYIAGRKLDKGESINLNSLFGGFNVASELIGPYVIMVVMVILGFILLVIPGIYLSVAYLFVIPLAYFGSGMQPWDILETSRKVISKNWFSFFGFVIVLGLINILGVIALGVGLLITLPLTSIAFYVAFKRVFGFDGDTQSDSDIIYEELR